MGAITAGRIANALRSEECPSWCVRDHSNDDPENVFHRSDFSWLRPDGALSGNQGPWELAAQLVLPQADTESATLVVDLGDAFGPFAELTVATADQFIRDLKTFTARVQQMRDQLAAWTGASS